MSTRHTHTHSDTHSHRHTHTDTQTQTHTHTQTQTRTHTDTHIHRNTHTDTHTHRHTHTQTHTQTHTHTHTHTHRSQCFENTRPNAALCLTSRLRLKPEVSLVDPGGTYEGTMTIFRLDSGETPGPPGLGAASLTNGQSHTGEL